MSSPKSPPAVGPLCKCIAIVSGMIASNNYIRDMAKGKTKLKKRLQIKKADIGNVRYL